MGLSRPLGGLGARAQGTGRVEATIAPVAWTLGRPDSGRTPASDPRLGACAPRRGGGRASPLLHERGRSGGASPEYGVRTPPAGGAGQRSCRPGGNDTFHSIWVLGTGA